ncbi:MAG: polysaccharide biosynthesis/export family protein [Sinobacteraceae bacterium]|nr:polysaccharide biosynthesis/export family protein [Nevskiaceae bacterium]
MRKFPLPRRAAAMALSCVLFLALAPAELPAQDAASDAAAYLVKPGDVLFISVWREEDLQIEALVSPAGRFSFPLVGELQAAGRSVTEIQNEIVERLETYIPDAVATVMLRSIEGNKAYVVGKVNRPGPILMTSDTNVMQALSIAGGTAQFAGLDDIVILRGQGSDQTAIPFNYDEVEDGKHLEQNITLQAGDVVVVP